MRVIVCVCVSVRILLDCGSLWHPALCHARHYTGAGRRPFSISSCGLTCGTVLQWGHGENMG